VSAGLTDPAWSKTYGGSDIDTAMSVIPVSDGYVIGGTTHSFDIGNGDACLIKADRNGNLVWQKAYGGTLLDRGRIVVPAGDGYLLAGSARSFDPDMKFYLIRTDGNGNMLWQHTYGGKDWCDADALIAVDGGFLVAGFRMPYGESREDVYLVKTDTEGHLVWDSVLPGPGGVSVGSALADAGDGYLVAGYTNATGTGYQAYLVKTDNNGRMVWNRTYRGKGYASAASVLAVADGCLFVGFTHPDNDQTSEIYLVKTDREGNEAWNRTFSDGRSASAYSIMADDDGYVIAGTTSVMEAGRARGVHYFMKTDRNGNLVWNRTCGMADGFNPMAAAAIKDGWVVAGFTMKPDPLLTDILLDKITADNATGPGTAIPAPSPTPALAVAALLAGAACMAALKKKAG
jgi:hypothetical protein